MTDTQQTEPVEYCKHCGKALHTSVWEDTVGNFCSVKCMEAGIAAIRAALEADLTEALDMLERHTRETCDFLVRDLVNELDPDHRHALRFLAKHGRFKITRDEEWTEGEWVNS